MTWHIQYRDNASDHVARHPSPEAAIEAACRLIDDGCEVYGIGTGPLTDSIARDEIARIYAFWARAKYPVGKHQTDAPPASRPPGVAPTPPRVRVARRRSPSASGAIRRLRSGI